MQEGDYQKCVKCGNTALRRFGSTDRPLTWYCNECVPPMKEEKNG